MEYYIWCRFHRLPIFVIGEKIRGPVDIYKLITTYNHAGNGIPDVAYRERNSSFGICGCVERFARFSGTDYCSGLAVRIIVAARNFIPVQLDAITTLFRNSPIKINVG